MQVGQRVYYLAVDAPGVVLGHPPVLLAFQEAVCTASRHVLEYQDDLVLGLDRVEQLSDVWVVQSLHQPDLTTHRLLPLDVLDLLLLVDLEGDGPALLPVHALPHDGVGALAYLLSEDIFGQTMLLTEDNFFDRLVSFIVACLFFGFERLVLLRGASALSRVMTRLLLLERLVLR